MGVRALAYKIPNSKDGKNGAVDAAQAAAQPLSLAADLTDRSSLMRVTAMRSSSAVLALPGLFISPADAHGPGEQGGQLGALGDSTHEW
jgi:hypothetical protein